MPSFRTLLDTAATSDDLQAQLREQEEKLANEVLKIGVIEKENTVKAGAAERANYAMLRSNIDADQLPSLTVVQVNATTAADPVAFKTFYTPLIQNNTVFDYAIAIIGGDYRNVILMRPGATSTPGQVSAESVLVSTTAGQSTKGKAASFADPADLTAFRKCKKAGKSDIDCFKVGDNGIGFMGDDCTGAVPMCALPPEVWLKRWGSKTAAHLKPVDVTIGGKTVRCLLGDTMPHVENITNGAGIDLNPAAVAAFGLKPPMMENAEWSWA